MKHYCKMCGGLWDCRDNCGYDYISAMCEKCVMSGRIK